MQIDALALRLRPRTPYEAADLGTRLCQSAARGVLSVTSPSPSRCTSFACARSRLRIGCPCSPCIGSSQRLDRTILLRALARSVRPAHDARPICGTRSGRCGGTSSSSRSRGGCCRPGARSPSPSISSKACASDSSVSAFCRSAAGIRLRRRSRSVRLQALRDQPHGPRSHRCSTGLRRAGRRRSVRDAELAGRAALHALIFARAPRRSSCCSSSRSTSHPGFAMYLTRRAELEAWDIEQEFRRAFSAVRAARRRQPCSCLPRLTCGAQESRTTDPPTGAFTRKEVHHRDRASSRRIRISRASARSAR